MKKLNLIQNSPEWHDARQKHIGASDVSIIMGINPWKKPHALYLEKIGEGKASFVTKKMQAGIDNEKTARDKFNLESEYVFSPDVGESDNLSFIMASFDGLTSDDEVILEVKSFDNEKFLESKNSEIPIYYMTQMQTQLWVNEKAKKCIYLVSNTETGEYFTREVYPDVKMQAEIVEKCCEFWERVLKKDPPEKPEELEVDEEEINKTALEWKLLSAQEKKIKEELNKLTENIDKIKEKLRAYSNKQTMIFTQANVRALTYPVTGTVDWEKLCDAHNISKEEQNKYKKKGTEKFKLSLVG